MTGDCDLLSDYLDGRALIYQPPCIPIRWVLLEFMGVGQIVASPRIFSGITTKRITSRDHDWGLFSDPNGAVPRFIMAEGDGSNVVERLRWRLMAWVELVKVGRYGSGVLGVRCGASK